MAFGQDGRRRRAKARQQARPFSRAGLLGRSPRESCDLRRRQACRLYPRTRQGGSGAVRHRARHRGRTNLCRRRRRCPLHHPIGVEALHVRLRAAASRPGGGAEAGRSGAHWRSLQLDRARRKGKSPLQPDGQCRSDRGRRVDAGRGPERTHRQHARAVLAPRWPQACDRRGGVPVGARHRPPQPRHRLHDAQYWDARARPERGARRLFPPVFGLRHGARPRPHGGDARQ